MKKNILRLPQLVIAFATLLFGMPVLALPHALQDTQQPMPDNTKNNRDQSQPTADQQKMNPSDRAISQKIRKSIHDDKSLSTYGHNIKVITQDGKVTLRGPVKSEDEKNSLQEKAVAVVGQENVTNQLEVTPPSK